MTALLPANMQSKIRLDECPVDGLEMKCWTWTGASTNCYGSVCYQGLSWSSHRLAYTLLVGAVPEGLTLDHLCLNKLCCNPAHIEPVTNRENLLRRHHGIGYTAPVREWLSPEELAAVMKPFDDFFAASDEWLMSRSYEPRTTS